MSDSEIDSDEGSQIRISLVLAKGCAQTSLVVPSDPIAVPSDTRKKGLSAIVNHLLGRKVVSDKSESEDGASSSEDEDEEKLPAIPFDFLLNQKLLRMSIDAATRKEGLSVEEAVEIQYFPAKSAPEGDGESEKLPDWISAMGSLSDYLISGGCDGSIRVFDKSKNLRQIDTAKVHSGPVKCLDSAYVQSSDSIIIGSGSMDQTLFTHLYSKDTESLALHALFSNGHTSSVNSLAMNSDPNGIFMASGDWQGGLCVWKVPSADERGKQKEGSNSKKKRRTSTKNSPALDIEPEEVTPTAYWKAHSNNISGMAWGYGSSNTLLTCSWDHSIKSWDVETQNVRLTLNGSKVVTCMGRCHNSDIIATGHPDCSVRLWDMRTSHKSQNGSSVFDSTLRPR